MNTYKNVNAKNYRFSKTIKKTGLILTLFIGLISIPTVLNTVNNIDKNITVLARTGGEYSGG